MLDRIIKSQLFWTKRKREERKTGARAASTEADAVERLYGTALPASIPETTPWWRRQSKDLMAMSEDAEMGLMQAMLTQSHNDKSPEMLAAVRRGPFSTPTDEEMIEYLLTRKRRNQDRPPFEHFSAEHVLSYQRRIQATKQHFMKRGKRTPLGRLIDWWDRTEAQMRAALHINIILWFRRRKMPEKWTPVPPIPRTVAGNELKMRGSDQKITPQAEYQEDNLYHKYECGRVTAEMPRPNVAGDGWGGYDVERLRIAGLARLVLERLPYLHRCTPAYCLKDRGSCRFFFPWAETPYQCYDMNTERVALQRRLVEDDQFVVPHNLFLTMTGTSSINVLPFDPTHGADNCRNYAGKYALSLVGFVYANVVELCVSPR